MTLKDLRKRQRLTQNQLADLVSLKIPISRVAISTWERGTRKPNRPEIKRLAEIFNTSVAKMYRVIYGEIKDKREAI